MFKLISFSTLCLLIAISFSCCKKKTTTNNTSNNDIVVDIDRSDTTSLPASIPPLAVSLDFSATPMQIDTFATKVDEYIAPYGFGKDDIIKVNLIKLNMVLENAPGQTFNFVKDSLISLKVFVDSFGGSAPKLVAQKVNIPQGVSSMEFDVMADDIKDYFRADYMKILVAFRTQENEGLAANAKFRVNYTFRVTAKKP
ncbi:MAG: hypothetical protein IPK62_08260 [Bacteroidetes bacterium]|jgi:hypothetical protein|nr:hypothetical protein [Bacteroidota bacterium]